MRDLKKGKVNKEVQRMIKKISPNEDGSSISKEKLGIGISSQILSIPVLLVGRGTTGSV